MKVQVSKIRFLKVLIIKSSYINKPINPRIDSMVNDKIRHKISIHNNNNFVMDFF